MNQEGAKGNRNMSKLNSIKKMLEELEEQGAKFCLTKLRKSYYLTFKDNEKAEAQFVMGLNDIYNFLLAKCLVLDAKTGIKCF